MDKKTAAKKLALGSWHTFSRQTFSETCDFVTGALERGINDFDIADYWDVDIKNTERFRKVLQSTGIKREDVRIGIKVFTNSASTRLADAKNVLSLIGTDYADYVVVSRPAADEPLRDAVLAMNELTASGLAKEMDFSLWGAAELEEAFCLMKEMNLALPKFIQFQYNICRRGVVESAEYKELLDKTGLTLQASFPLEGGILCGHTDRKRYEPADKANGIWFEKGGRNLARDSGGIRDTILTRVPLLKERAEKLGLSAAQLSIAYVALHPQLENILFGATKLWEIDEAIEAVCFAADYPEEVRAAAEDLDAGGEPPKLFDMSFTSKK